MNVIIMGLGGNLLTSGLGVVSAPAPISETAPIIFRAPMVRNPLVYYDRLYVEMEPWWYFGAETSSKRSKPIARIPLFRSLCLDCEKSKDMLCANTPVNTFHLSDCQKNRDMFYTNAPVNTFALMDIFKMKESPNSLSIIQIEMPDELESRSDIFKTLERLFIFEADESLGIH